jgi:hypothetical protein
MTNRFPYGILHSIESDNIWLSQSCICTGNLPTGKTELADVPAVIKETFAEAYAEGNTEKQMESTE